MASRRRKRPLPVRLNNEEQQQLAWNMTDLMTKRDGIARTGFREEDELCSSGLGNPLNILKNNETPKKKQKFMHKKNSSFTEIVELKLQNVFPEFWHCHIGTFRVRLNNEHYYGTTLNSTGHLDSLTNDMPSSPRTDTVEVKVTLNLESIIDNEVGNDFITHGSTLSKEFHLPTALRTLSMKAFTNVPPDILQTLESLQKKGLVSLVIHSKSSVFHDSWDIIVCLCESALTKMKFASEDVRVRNTDKMMQSLMEFFFKGICDTGSKGFISRSEQMEFSSLYETVMKRREQNGKMKNESIRSFVSKNKSGFNSCKCDGSCSSKLRMNGQLSQNYCFQLSQKKIEINHDDGTAHNQCKDTVGSELQSDQKPECIQSKEVQSIESCVHEGTGFSSSKLPCDFQHEHLKPTLRQYQRRAVQWMVDKENGGHSKGDSRDETDLHYLWRRCVTLDKKVIFFNPYIGRLTTEHFTSPVLPPGGILADEMGLGKTVEVLACILNNPKPEHGVYNKDVNNAKSDQLQTESSTSLQHSSTRTSFIPIEPSEKIPSQEAMLSNPCEQLWSPLSTSLWPTSSSTSSELLSTTMLNPSTTQLVTYTTTLQPVSLVSSSKSTTSTTSVLPITPSQYIPSLPQSAGSATSSTPLIQSTVSVSSTLMVSSSSSTSSSMQLLSEQSSREYMSSVATSSENEEIKTISTFENSNSPVSMTVSIPPCTTEEKNPSPLTPVSDVLRNSSLDVSKDGSSHTLDSIIPVLTTQNISTKPEPTIKNNPYLKGYHASTVHNSSNPATLAIKCICGNTKSDLDDVLLKCKECSALSHASCLGHSGTYQQTDVFLCPTCAVNRPPIPSCATLIISPATIAHQWVEEITRHTTPSALRLLVYEGVAKQGFIQPDMLADHDVILTTYATLRADLNHLGTQHGRSLRYQKRYIALPSPLTAIKFWRICLDEAQMVETTTAKAAEMALRLECVNRWCVTGTPIQKGLEDLYGLLLFLGVFPYCQRVWWNKLLYEPYLRGHKEPMYNALADLLWRTAKKNVLDEIHLPSQTEIVVRLNFTPVEEHFYRRQHEECSTSIHVMLSRFSSSNIKLNSLDRNTVHRMLIPLLRLRQACCHPQAVRGGFLSMQKSTMTMDQLLEVLIARAKLECEEAHRQLLFAINGLAGTHTIKEEWPEAVDLYRESMRSWMEHEDKFRTDALQKLHTLHNLSDLLSSSHPGCSRTLRDDKLKDEAEELVKKYMAKPNTQVQAAQEHLTGAEKNIEELLKKVQFQAPWWLLAVDSVESSGQGHELINRVKEELSSVSTDTGSILNSFTDIRGLGYTVTTKLDTVESTHSSLVQALNQLRTYPTPEMVHATAVCCLRSTPQRTSQATRCKFCEVDDIFTEYESRLFGHQGMKGVSEDEDASNRDWHRHGNTGGLRAETEAEKVLKTLFAFIKSQRLIPSVHQDARNHLAFMEARRKEFKFLRGAWFALRERVSSLDELEMCTTKLRLALPGEPVNEDEKHVIHRGQVEQQKLKFISDRVIARTELRKKLGQYLYLTNLAKSQKFSEGENPDPCPVCTKKLGKEWSVFSCGHCYCCQCVWVLLRQAGIGPRNRDVHIKCPICRFPTLAREISYVCTGKDTNDGDKGVLVKGSHSTKVEAVVRALLKIKAEDETMKCLVFSTWQDVLELIGKALRENDINFRHITCGGKRFQTDLHVFKEDPDVPVLLLPLQSGSNGLNIIEATHVLLVEPALNPAHELQAVGRVHRIGQTRPTFVHRFIINNTVESRMHSLLNGKSKDVVRTGSKDTENSTLTIADLTSLFKEDNDPTQIKDYSDNQEDVEMIT